MRTKVEHQKYMLEWSRQNTDKVAKYTKVYRETHREELRAKSRARYAANKERLREQIKAWHQNGGDLTPGMRWCCLKKQAKKHGRQIFLTREQWWAIVEPNCCHYCNGPLEPTQGPSLDRKDNAVDYTVENVVPCCTKCNTAKMKSNYEEFRAHVRQIYQHWAQHG